MPLFDAIQYVGTPIALVAFLVAVIAYAYRGRLEERRKLIEAAPEQERGRLLEKTLRDFTTVPTESLSRDQRYQLAVKLIDERSTKFRVFMIGSVVLSLILATVVLLVSAWASPVRDAGALVVRVHGPAGPSDFITRGSIILDAGSARVRRELGAEGEVRFENIPDAAFENGVEVLPQIAGYHAVSPTTLKEVPAGRVYRLEVAPDPSEVFGTVIDVARQPLRGIVLNFQAGMAIDTTDENGNFRVTLPFPPGVQVPVRGSRGGVTGVNERITIPDRTPLTLFFDPGS